MNNDFLEGGNFFDNRKEDGTGVAFSHTVS
jgi:hypothetical protein